MSIMAEKYSDPDPPSILKRQPEEKQKVYLWDVNQSKNQRRVKFLLNEEQQQKQVKLEMGDLFLKDHTSKRTYMYRDEEDETLNTGVSRWTSLRNTLCCCCTVTTCCGRQRLVTRRPAFTNIVISQEGSRKSGKAKRDPKLDIAYGSQEKEDDNVQSEESSEEAEGEDVLHQEEGTDEDDVCSKKEGKNVRPKEEATEKGDLQIWEVGTQREDVSLKGEGTQVEDVLHHKEGTEDEVHLKSEEDVYLKEEAKEKENVPLKEVGTQGIDVSFKEDDEKREGDDNKAVNEDVQKEEKTQCEDEETWEDAIAEVYVKEEESSPEISADINSIDEKMNAINDVEEKISEEKLDDKTKPKRGKLSRMRRFLRRLCCCCWCGKRKDRIFRERFDIKSMSDGEIRKRYRFEEESIDKIIQLVEHHIGSTTKRLHALSTELQV